MGREKIFQKTVTTVTVTTFLFKKTVTTVTVTTVLKIAQL